MEKSVTPAAQYLRMSTDFQQYSLDNQADAIARYAAANGFRIVKTYSDAARSGLRLKNRAGLKQLLKDVVDGQFEFQAVLVYDVSRWGRFQDMDEAAHYEYLCKSAGVPVYYCAELFSNSGNVTDFILKALKRMMAGEYSRDLSVKVRDGMFRLASRGYRLGGMPGYGFRRQLLDSHGAPKQLLDQGEHKSITTERVSLVPSSTWKVSVIQRIFKEFVEKRRSMSAIATGLNENGVSFLTGKKWAWNNVKYILRNPQYAGTQVWGRTTALLSTPVKTLPKEKWAICANAFTPMVSQELFEKAQTRLANFTWRLSNAQLLEKLEAVLKTYGKINSEIISRSPGCPGTNTYYNRFGGLSNAYAQLGYMRPELTAALASRQRIRVMRRELITLLLTSFPEDLQEIRPARRKSLLKQTKTGLLIAVLLMRSFASARNGRFWLVDYRIAQKKERERVTLVGLLDSSNSSISELRLFPTMQFGRNSIRLYEAGEWLQTGARLCDISDFLKVLAQLKSYSGLTTSRH